MTSTTAFIGDIHGNLEALHSLWDRLSLHNIEHTVFLGDYINKGSRSAEVLEFLFDLADSGTATLLLGNHELELLNALDTGDLRGFLKIGGAATIRSYVAHPVGPNVLADFILSIPQEHVDALRLLPMEYLTNDLIARHVPQQTVDTTRYSVSAHSPIGDVPRIGSHAAQLDTGCGEDGGRLTALLWPGLGYIQVDNTGTVINE